MNEYIGIILGSTVISAIVNQIFSTINNKKTREINNITKERKLWRRRIRKLVKQLNSDENNDVIKIKRLINEIKNNINPFGIIYVNNNLEEFESTDENITDDNKNRKIAGVSSVFLGVFFHMDGKIQGRLESSSLFQDGWYCVAYLWTI